MNSIGDSVDTPYGRGVIYEISHDFDPKLQLLRGYPGVCVELNELFGVTNHDFYPNRLWFRWNEIAPIPPLEALAEAAE